MKHICDPSTQTQAVAATAPGLVFLHVQLHLVSFHKADASIEEQGGSKGTIDEHAEGGRQ